MDMKKYDKVKRKDKFEFVGVSMFLGRSEEW